MTRLISEILDIPQPHLYKQIEELERLAGRPALDIKLTGELKLLFKEKARSLGLDENDTTPKELYFAMTDLALKHSEELAHMIGVKTDDSPKRMAKKAIDFVEKRIGKKTVWALKSSVARRQLKENPPKKLMKIFGIRSIDSALKRERISLLYCFARMVESPSWSTKYAIQARELTNSDFNSSQITISVLADNRRRQLLKAGVKLNHIIYVDQETAGIELTLPDKRFRGDILFVVDSILTQTKLMLRRSAYFKSQSLRPNFFARIEKIRQSGFRDIETEKQPFDWPTLVHAAAELGIADLVQKDEPLISTEDLLGPGLVQLAGLNFWKHPFAIYKDSDILVSSNLSDMIINAINGLAAEQAYIENGREALKRELFGRYLKYEPLQNKALQLHSFEEGRF